MWKEIREDKRKWRIKRLEDSINKNRVAGMSFKSNKMVKNLLRCHVLQSLKPEVIDTFPFCIYLL